jgi:Protein of unknown function (DUF2786)
VSTAAERIRKLERLAADPAAFPAEAEVARRKAAELRELPADRVEPSIYQNPGGPGFWVIYVEVGPMAPDMPPPVPRGRRDRSSSRGSRSDFSWDYTSAGPRR